MIQRHISQAFKHFHDKLIFVYGPRQAGKTFIIEQELKPDLILNMDIAKERLSFKKFPDFIFDWYNTNYNSNEITQKPLVFIDEIHKVKGWRNLIKGTFDKTHHLINYVASGSSAFNLRRQDQGDSLSGRAIWLPLFPVTFREFLLSQNLSFELPEPWVGDNSMINKIRSLRPHQEVIKKHWDTYEHFGSFPENLVKQDDIFYKQWLDDYVTALLDRDLKDLNVAKDVERVYQVFLFLLEGLSSAYSLRSLAEKLSVSPNTIKSDIRALKQVMWGFEMPVVNISKGKQVQKEIKFYPLDHCFTSYQTPEEKGALLETTIAAQLYRSLYTQTQKLTSTLQLGYFRDYQKREIDFVIRSKKKIVLGIECKAQYKPKHLNALNSFIKKFSPTEMLLVVSEPNIYEIKSDICIVSQELVAACLL